MPENNESAVRLQFDVRNLSFLGAAVACIGAGYLLLSGGSMFVAPLLLVLGYCVFFPLGLVL